MIFDVDTNSPNLMENMPISNNAPAINAVDADQASLGGVDASPRSSYVEQAEEPTSSGYTNAREHESNIAWRRKRKKISFFAVGALAVLGVAATITTIVLLVSRDDEVQSLLTELQQMNNTPMSLTLRANSAHQQGLGDEIELVVVPRVNETGSIRFDGQMKYHQDGQEVVFTLQDDRAYYWILDGNATRPQVFCLPEKQVPPLYEDRIAVKEVAEHSHTKLPATHIHSTSTNIPGEPYVICFGTNTRLGKVKTDSPQALVQSILGEDIEMTFQVTGDKLDKQAGETFAFSIPTDESGQVIDCPKVSRERRIRTEIDFAELQRKLDPQSTAQEASITSTLRGRPVINFWPWDLSEDDEELASSKRTHDCIFFHGAGQTEDKPPTTTYKDYWGNLGTDERPPYCKTVTFVHRNTKTITWLDENLQKYFCTTAVGNNGGGKIVNKVIFTHSMGNLIFAAALSKAFCTLDSSSAWYSVQGPMIGSKAATFVKESCATNEGILDNVGEWLGYCYEEGVKEAYGEMVWHTDASPVLKLQYNRAAAAMIAHVKGIMCGVDSFGLNTKDAVALSALAAAVRHGEDNDGMVSWSSCSLHGNGLEAPWGNSYSDPYYEADVNHADGTCRHGDGWWGADRKPCKWYRSIVPPSSELVKM